MELSDDLIYVCILKFEAARGVPLHDVEAEFAESLQFNNFDPDSLALFLVKRIENPEEGDARFLPSMFFALGKRYDPTLLTFFRTALRSALAASPESIYQILIALDNLDETVFAPDRNDSFSVLDEELNRRDALAYLTRVEGEIG